MKLNTLRDAEKYGSWVCRISKNCAKDIVIGSHEYVSIDCIQLAEQENGEFFGLCEDDDGERLHESISALSQKVREVIELHYFNGLSVDEIAKKLRVPVGTVKWRLHDGREKIRKDYDIPEMNDIIKNDAFVEKVMAKVEEIRRFVLKNNKSDFDEKYADTLADVESLPESKEKYYALADVLKYGAWWCKNVKIDKDKLNEKMLDAAIKGGNDDVFSYILEMDNEKHQGKDRIEFMRDTQIPFAQKYGMKKAEAYEWFWLARQYFLEGERENGAAASGKVLELTEPSDIYYVNTLSSMKIEKLIENVDPDLYQACTYAEEYRVIDGQLRFWSSPGYWLGNRSTGAPNDFIFASATECDRMFFAPDMKPGGTFIGSDGKTAIEFTDSDAAVDTPCGRFTGCHVYKTVVNKRVMETYFKDGVGIVRQVRYANNISVTNNLKAYKVNGGSGLLPMAAGNYWEYDRYSEADKDILDHSDIRYEVTYADGKKALLSCYWCIIRKPYSEDNWDDMIYLMRKNYWKQADGDGEDLVDVSRYMERAEALAVTPLQKTHTKVACEVMRRIFATDAKMNPNRTAEGLWNFFEYSTVGCDDGKLLQSPPSAHHGFEWKDIPVKGEGYQLLFNFIYDILYETTGCLWSDEWKPGASLTVNDPTFNNGVTSKLDISDGMTLTAAAGTFENCLKMNVETTGFPSGLSYRNGLHEYFFAPSVGLVRAVNHYGEGKTAVYELASYVGTGEGYMPVGDGFERKYKAVALTGGYEGGADYYFCDDGSGTIVMLDSLTGIRNIG